jgi:hypothetical protein
MSSIPNLTNPVGAEGSASTEGTFKNIFCVTFIIEDLTSFVDIRQ